MIVNAPQLIVPRSHWGWSRYGAVWEGPNFLYPDGKAGYINGIVEEVPAGTDIVPRFPVLGNSNDTNCQSVSRYLPPSSINFYLEISGQNPSPCMTRCETDCKIYDMAGGLIDLVGALQGRCHMGTFSYLMASLAGNVDLSVSPRTAVVQYKSPKGGALELVEYEQGGDGIVTIEIKTGNPYAVKARRLSDQTDQIVPAGGIYLPAGAGEIKIGVAWASGLPALQSLAKFKYSIEVPYGI